MSRQAEALKMFLEDPRIGPILKPYMDLTREQINWHELNYGVLSGGEKAAISWAYCIWTDTQIQSDWLEYPGYQMRDPFMSFGVMDSELQALCIKAFLHRHERLSRDRK